MTDKHQALRDALARYDYDPHMFDDDVERASAPVSIRALLADHDRMREALERISKRSDACSDESAGDACETLKECGQ